MSQKTLIGIIAIVIIIAVIVVISFSKFSPKQQETKESVQPETKKITLEDLDESMKSMIEKLEPTCVDFLAGELSGDADLDCPGFDNPVNKNLCFYCFAAKNQNPTLCEKIDDDSGFKIVCQRATGSSIEEIISQ